MKDVQEIAKQCARPMRHQQNRAPREDGEFGLEHECSSGSLVVPEPEQARLASGRRRGKRYLWCALVASLAMLMLTQSQGWPAGAANCQPSSLKHKQQRRHLQQQQQQRQSPQQEHLARANAATSGRSQTSSSCSPNCLAIPLVTIMGHKRLDGFLLSGSQRKPVSANLAHVGSASEYPAGAGWIHYIGDASSSSSSSSKAPSALYNKRPPYLNTLDLPMSDHMSTRPPHLVELPRSDEKCPMTGPMTVCDQIGSYPAELILSKLASVKEILRSSNFNLDSMFTDEREHSSDPFEDISSSSPSINETRQQHRPASLISSPVHPNIDRIPLHPANQREQPTRRNYRSSMAEFVDLVERSAIRLDSSRRPPSAAYLKRARRQLDSVVSLSSTASSSSSMSTPKPNVQVLAAAGFQSGSSQAEPQDPERVTSFAGPTPEPICRARSTYISPRAAVSFPLPFIFCVFPREASLTATYDDYKVKRQEAMEVRGECT